MFEHQACKQRSSESLHVYFILYAISLLCCWAKGLKRQGSGKGNYVLLFTYFPAGIFKRWQTATICVRIFDVGKYC